jgi:hypothetical protein
MFDKTFNFGNASTFFQRNVNLDEIQKIDFDLYYNNRHDFVQDWKTKVVKGKNIIWSFLHSFLDDASKEVCLLSIVDSLKTTCGVKTDNFCVLIACLFVFSPFTAVKYSFLNYTLSTDDLSKVLAFIQFSKFAFGSDEPTNANKSLHALLGVFKPDFIVDLFYLQIALFKMKEIEQNENTNVERNNTFISNKYKLMQNISLLPCHIVNEYHNCTNLKRKIITIQGSKSSRSEFIHTHLLPILNGNNIKYVFATKFDMLCNVVTDLNEMIIVDENIAHKSDINYIISKLNGSQTHLHVITDMKNNFKSINMKSEYITNDPKSMLHIPNDCVDWILPFVGDTKTLSSIIHAMNLSRVQRESPRLLLLGEIKENYSSKDFQRFLRQSKSEFKLYGFEKTNIIDANDNIYSIEYIGTNPMFKEFENFKKIVIFDNGKECVKLLQCNEFNNKYDTKKIQKLTGTYLQTYNLLLNESKNEQCVVEVQNNKQFDVGQLLIIRDETLISVITNLLKQQQESIISYMWKKSSIYTDDTARILIVLNTNLLTCDQDLLERFSNCLFSNSNITDLKKTPRSKQFKSNKSLTFLFKQSIEPLLTKFGNELSSIHFQFNNTCFEITGIDICNSDFIPFYDSKLDFLSVNTPSFSICSFNDAMNKFNESSRKVYYKKSRFKIQ